MADVGTKYAALGMLGYILAMIALHGDVFVAMMDFKDILPYLATTAAFLLLYFTLLKQRLRFWETFFHEVTHVVFALLCFNRIEGFSATRLSGGVTAYTGRSNWLIRLAPYFFPLFAASFLLVAGIALDAIRTGVLHVFVATYCWFLITALTDFSYVQPDIQKSGRVFSTAFVLAAHALMLIAVAFLLDGKMDDFVYLVGKYAFGQGSFWGDLWRGVP